MNRLNPIEFKNTIDSIEYQKPYLFKLILPLIELGGVWKLKPNQGHFELCTAATSFPVMTSAVQQVAYYNSELKFPTKTTYSNWNATFRLDLNYKSATANNEEISTYEYFYSWQLAAYNPTTRTSYLPKEYKKCIDLILLNEACQETAGFKLEGAFPVSISGGNLSYIDDGILTYNVDFAFDRFILVNDYVTFAALEYYG